MLAACRAKNQLYSKPVGEKVELVALDSERMVAVLVILGICGVMLYRFYLWIMAAPRTKDPWGKELDDEVDNETAVPLCHHCFTPQEHNGWFCPECGATVGTYCNYMPFVYVFAQGEVLRAGVTERIRQSGLIITGYILFSLTMYAILAPVYWFFLFKHLREIRLLPQDAQPLGG